MPRTRQTQRKKPRQKDVVARLADIGEEVLDEALRRLVELPPSRAVHDAITSSRDRLDEMATKLRKLDPLERRVTALEKRLDSLQKPKQPARKRATRRTTASRAAASRTASPAPGATSSGSGSSSGSGPESSPS
jgi:hypothetical protein